MAKRYRAPRKKDIARFRATAVRTKAVNRASGNAQGGIRF